MQGWGRDNGFKSRAFGHMVGRTVRVSFKQGPLHALEYCHPHICKGSANFLLTSRRTKVVLLRFVPGL